MAKPQEDAAQNTGTVMMTADQLKDFVAGVVKEIAGVQGGVREGDNRYKVHTRIPAEQKMVTVNLFKDNGKYSEALYACVNGKRYVVPRGKPVEIPESVAEIIATSMQQDNATEAEMLRRADVWDAKVEKL